MDMNRRGFLTGALTAGAMACATKANAFSFSSLFGGVSGAPMHGYAAPKIPHIRLGIVGMGGRGQGVMERIKGLPGIDVVAICDCNPKKIAESQQRLANAGKAKAKEYLGTEAWRQLCDDPNVDVVYNTTPWELHVPVALAAMKGGKHVFTEVPSAFTVDECWELVETSEKTKMHCMQLENCCYGETELLALNLCRKGVLGDLMYGEAAYVHDLSGQALSKEGDVEWWRLDWNAQHKGNQYPTHGLGPVCQYLGINRGDQFDHLVSMENRQARMTLRAEAKKAGRFLGKEIAMADMNTTLIRTKLGRMILLAHDVSSPRPYTRYNTIQGTKGILTDYPYRVAFETEIGDGKAHKYFKEEEAEKVRKDYMHPLWAAAGELGKKIGGHGGMDFVMDLRWVYCLMNGLPLDMDVYDLAAWSSMCELTERSVRAGSRTLDCVDFTRGAWQTAQPLGIETVDMSKFNFKDMKTDKNALNV